ncbi:MAG: hypothetical protein ACLQPH_20280 [Acidimicrobiales bacterium]
MIIAEPTVTIAPTRDPLILRDLAAAIQGNSHSARARRSLSPESVEELAAMITVGKVPTVGWWRRHAA